VYRRAVIAFELRVVVPRRSAPQLFLICISGYAFAYFRLAASFKPGKGFRRAQVPSIIFETDGVPPAGVSAAAQRPRQFAQILVIVSG